MNPKPHFGTMTAGRLRLIAVLAAVVLALVLTVSAFAAIGFGHATTAQNSPAGATTLTIAQPLTMTAGDFLLAQIAFHTGVSATIDPPEGWTLVLRTDNASDIGQAIYSKVAGGTEPASYIWTFSSGQTRAAGGILRYTGVDPVNPIVTAAGNVGEGDILTATSVTAEANSLLVAAFGIKEATLLSNPTLMTTRLTQRSPFPPAGDGDLSVRASDQPRPAGPTGDKISNAGAPDKWVAQQIVLCMDCTAPDVSITSPAANPTNGSPIPVTVQFSENATGFTAGDLSVTNGTVSNFVAVDGDTYTFDLTPTTDGVVTADIAAGAAQDTASNDNTAAPQFSRTFDGTSPSVSMSSSASDPTDVSPIPVTVQFNEIVSGFSAGDLSVTNGTVGNFVAVDGDTYTFDLTPTTDGVVTADIAAAVAQDAAGNDNTAATQFSRTFDTSVPDNTPPGVSMSSPAPNPTNVSPIPVTVQFSENVTGFEASDVSVINGTVSGFVGVDGDTYTFNLIPTADGVVTANIAAGVAQDAAGNNNTAASELSRTYDTTVPDNTPPSVSMTSSAPNPTNVSPIPVTVQFSEIVNGFVASDISVTNGTVSGFTVVDGDTYTFNLTPAADGIVTAGIAAGVAQDAAGNDNTAAPQFSRTFDASVPDSTPPSVSMSSSAPDPTNVSPIPVTVQFSENVTGFAAGDLSVSNGTVGNFAAVDGDTYTFDLTPAADGVVTADIAAGVAEDGAGNENTAAAQFSRTFDTSVPDNTAPQVTINQAAGQADPTTGNTVHFTVVFDEPVVGFAGSDVSLGGTAGANNVVATEIAPNNGTTFDIAVSGMSSAGTVIATIPADVANDAAGNGNQASTSTDNTITVTTEEPDFSLSMPFLSRQQPVGAQ
ncbi:MAG: hypothetical protein IT328_25175 [Caldilineaceae bacterium]|nr:hypothetical protein [Caldilineaceae bacterium]